MKKQGGWTDVAMAVGDILTRGRNASRNYLV
jgi:hypothetical protein